MALPDSSAAYEDCYEYFDKARASARGIRILVDNEKAAFHLRARLNYSRTIERRESMRIYERTDQRYGKSLNDKYKITSRPPADGETGYWVYIEEWAQGAIEIEEL